MDGGERVERMIAEGLRIAEQAVARWKVVATVGMYSSGDDSIVSTHFAMSYMKGDFAFNADTLVGLAPSRQHLCRVCEMFKWCLKVGKATAEGPPAYMLKDGQRKPFDPTLKLPAGRWVDGATAYEERVLNWGFPGRGKPQHSRIYRHLKERPIRRMLREFAATASPGGNKVLLVAGIRHDESANRAGFNSPVREGYFGDVWVNPFYHFTAADFEAYRQEFGLPRNPAKARCGISGECCCGTFANPAERPAYRVLDAPFADYLDDLQSRVNANGFPWGWGESPPAWWVREQREKRSGQKVWLWDDPVPEHFQPTCVGCMNGKR